MDCSTDPKAIHVSSVPTTWQLASYPPLKLLYNILITDLLADFSLPAKLENTRYLDGKENYIVFYPPQNLVTL